jgi:hypothetical protein
VNQPAAGRCGGEAGSYQDTSVGRGHGKSVMRAKELNCQAHQKGRARREQHEPPGRPSEGDNKRARCKHMAAAQQCLPGQQPMEAAATDRATERWARMLGGSHHSPTKGAGAEWDGRAQGPGMNVVGEDNSRPLTHHPPAKRQRLGGGGAGVRADARDAADAPTTENPKRPWTHLCQQERAQEVPRLTAQVKSAADKFHERTTNPTSRNPTM